MRSFFKIALGAFLACGPPSSFDNITGAPPEPPVIPPLVEDATLVAPRAIAPLSGSFFNGSRPTLRWDLIGPAIGARITLCGDPKCVGPKKKSFSANGRELTVPEDLEPGLWFWRLTSTTATSFGALPSRTFSLLVRGGTPGGTPAGSILDANGDGAIDLLVAVEGTGVGERFGVLLLGTNIDDPTLLTGELPEILFDAVSANAVFQSTDLDGDGFSDLIMASELVATGSPTPVPFIDVGTGAPGELGFDPDYRLPMLTLPPLDGVPFLRAPGDVDLDGYGDLLIGTKRSLLATYGGPSGPAVLSVLTLIPSNVAPDAGASPPPTSPIAASGHDVASDGRSGIVIASYDQGPPFFRLFADADRVYDGEDVLLVDTPPPTPATNFASGDLDGDGKTDLVFLTTVSGKLSTCLFAGSEVPLTAKIACWAPATVPAGFGENMVVADLEGDGKDEVIVSATTGGVYILSVPKPGELVGEPLALQEHGTRLTVMHPGRPKPAVWAATGSKGESIGIYRGRGVDPVKKIALPAMVGDRTSSKFGLPIR